MLTKKFARKYVNDFLTDVKLHGLNPTRAVIFGSVAKEKTHPYSDIDLALWDKEFEGCRPIDCELINKLLHKYPLLEVHTFPAHESANENPFIAEIEKNGLEIAFL